MAVEKKSSSLNPSQANRLLVTCKHIDALLEGIDETLNAAHSRRLFPGYLEDITPLRRQAIEERVAAIRERIAKVLAEQSLVPEEPQISASHSITVALTFMDIAITELAPRYMRGYGPVSQQAAADLDRTVAELQTVVKELQRYMQRSS